MLPFAGLSIDLDKSTETFARICPLITIEPPSETTSIDQLSINDEISSETSATMKRHQNRLYVDVHRSILNQ